MAKQNKEAPKTPPSPLPSHLQITCPSGFTKLKGQDSCVDFNECNSKNYYCSVDQTCYNTIGDHFCLDLTCPKNYLKQGGSAEGNCIRIRCKISDKRCLSSPIAIKQKVKILNFKTFSNNATAVLQQNFNIPSKVISIMAISSYKLDKRNHAIFIPGLLEIELENPGLSSPKIGSALPQNSRSDSPISVRKYNPALDSPNSSSILVKTHSNMQSMIDKYKITPNYIIKNQITIGVTSKGKLRKIATDFYILFHSQDVLEES